MPDLIWHLILLSYTFSKPHIIHSFPPFLSREKVENIRYRRDCKSKAATMRCRIRSGMTAGREGKIVNSFTVVAVLWAFEKVTGTSYK